MTARKKATVAEIQTGAPTAKAAEQPAGKAVEPKPAAAGAKPRSNPIAAKTPNPAKRESPAAKKLDPEGEALQALQPLAQGQARRAIEALVAVMTDGSAPPAARITAATTLLTWGYGRPQGEGECAPTNRAEPVIRLAWRESVLAPKEKTRKTRRRKS